MPTHSVMSTARRQQAMLDWRTVSPPGLSSLDRLALRFGVALILGAERRTAARADAAARRAGLAAGRRAAARQVEATFEHRAAAGPHW